MKTLARNKQLLHYALYKGKQEVTDSNGYKTGEYKIEYEEPVAVKMSIGPARGSANLEQYGIADASIKTLVTDDINCPITTSTILWIGIPITEPHNYIVLQPPLKSLNSVSITVKEVATS